MFQIDEIEKFWDKELKSFCEMQFIPFEAPKFSFVDKSFWDFSPVIPQTPFIFSCETFSGPDKKLGLDWDSL